MSCCGDVGVVEGTYSPMAPAFARSCAADMVEKGCSWWRDSAISVLVSGLWEVDGPLIFMWKIGSRKCRYLSGRGLSKQEAVEGVAVLYTQGRNAQKMPN